MAAHCINILKGLKHITPYELLKLQNKSLCSLLQISTKSIILTNIIYVSFNKYHISCVWIAALSFQINAKLFLNMTGENKKIY